MRKNRFAKQNISSLEFFRTMNWYKFAQYNDCILMKYLQLDSQRNPLSKKEVKQSYRVKIMLDFDRAEYVDYNEYKKTDNYIIQVLKKDKTFLNKYLKLLNKNCELCVDCSKKIKSIKDFKKYNQKELSRIFNNYISTILKIMPFVNTLSMFEKFLTNKLRNVLKKNKIENKKIPEYLLRLGNPNPEPFSFREKRELLKLTADIQRTIFFSRNKQKIQKLKLKDFPKNLQKKIKLHQKKYSWMGVVFMRGRPYSTNKFLEDLKELLIKDCIKELKKLTQERRKKENNIKSLIKKLNIFKQDISFFCFFREFAFQRTYRIDMIDISNYYALNFLKHIAERMFLEYEDLLYLTPPEIIKGLINQDSLKNKIKERKKGWGMILCKNKLELIVGRKYKQIKNEIFTKDYSKLNSVRGMTTYKGKGKLKLKGKAFIALNAEGVNKITKEDILVAPETTVDFEAAMKKARAIVTDRGGILSHAAIVSREFKKPCIVGTNFATKVFKTGDLIEVDANKGVVKIIKK